MKRSRMLIINKYSESFLKRLDKSSRAREAWQGSSLLGHIVQLYIQECTFRFITCPTWNATTLSLSTKGPNIECNFMSYNPDTFFLASRLSIMNNSLSQMLTHLISAIGDQTHKCNYGSDDDKKMSLSVQAKESRYLGHEKGQKRGNHDPGCPLCLLIVGNSRSCSQQLNTSIDKTQSLRSSLRSKFQ